MGSTLSPPQLEDFVRKQYALWNEGQFADLLALFRSVAPQGLVLEYVGRSVLSNGWKALEDMCATFGASMKIELVELIVNGDEAAVFALNKQTRRDGSVKVTPSIDLYRAKDGKLECRYFHT